VGKLIEFKKIEPEEIEKHGTGIAFCIMCKHEWTTAAPLGDILLECPKCGAMKGRWKYAYEPEFMWECNCGNTLFYISQEGVMCPNCGTYQSFPYQGERT
jgi:exosome complex RNA-binding protein Csl4